jgi:hypothetical protein
MKLVLTDGTEVVPGMEVKDFRGDKHFVHSIVRPHKPSSTGRVYLKETREGDAWDASPYFPGVINAKWEGREDVA